MQGQALASKSMLWVSWQKAGKKTSSSPAGSHDCTRARKQLKSGVYGVTLQKLAIDTKQVYM